jgi:hypothetical protein
MWTKHFHNCSYLFTTVHASSHSYTGSTRRFLGLNNREVCRSGKGLAHGVRYRFRNRFGLFR